MKVYLADTGGHTLSRVALSLQRTGFVCESVSAESGFNEFASHHPEPDLKGVFLLGVGISDRSKRIWVTHIRSRYPNLTILNMADPTGIEQIHALSQKGADDWISPSVHSRELIARIGVLLRHAYPDEVAAKTLEANPYKFTFFPNRAFREGQEITLTAKEFDVAFFLFSHVGQTLSRQLLCEAVWQSPLSETGRTVDTHVSRVRSRLGLKDGVYGYVLEQLYGYGYLLRHI